MKFISTTETELPESSGIEISTAVSFNSISIQSSLLLLAC